jgi:MFS family permease
MKVSRDARILLFTRGVRSLSDGFVSVLLVSYLAALGFSGVRVGAVATATLLGTAVATLIVGAVTNRLGRRRVLFASTLLAVGTGIAFASSSSFVPVLLIAVVGTLNPTAGDVSVFLPVEQSILPQTVDASARTSLFARYNLVGALAAATGALLAGVPTLLHRWLDWDLLQVMRGMFVLYAGLALVNLLAYRMLTPAVEPRTITSNAPLHRSRGTVFRLSGLFAIDSFGGGFVVQSILALWLFRRYGLSVDQAAVIFFAAGIFTAFSFLVAARVAERFGLINTMVFTHLPSNILLILVALMPNVWLAVAMLLARQSLSQMDVPTRQSYVMAVVDEDERAAAASVTGVARSLASSGSPVLAGALLGATTFGWPLVIAGTLKGVYDLLLLAQFRGVKPAEEIVAVDARSPRG